MHRTPQRTQEEAEVRARREMRNAGLVFTITFIVFLLIGLVYWITHRYLF